MIILAVLAGTGLLVTGCVERRMSSSQLNVYDTTVNVYCVMYYKFYQMTFL